MSKKKKKKKFTQIWSNQTNLGKKFGLSAIAVGKILIQNGLKDEKTKIATHKSIEEGFAKATPLKDGTSFYMWNVEKIRDLIKKDHNEISKVEYYINEVRQILRSVDKEFDEGSDKIACLMMDCMYDDVPKDIKEEVKQIIEKERFEKDD